MIFRKNIEPRCAYCKCSEPLDEDRAVCQRKGIIQLGGHCRHFDYDPLKRIPPVQAVPNFSKYKDEDFSL